MSAGDTIFALSSAPGRAAIAVIRVSGPATFAALRAIAGPLPAPRAAALRRLVRPGTADVLDHGLVLTFPAPSSQTGEDVAELHVHGGRAVVSAILETLGRIAGCRPAEPGEFARRAFHNGKLDLTGAEGLADLVDAQTEAQRRQALRQAGGALDRLYSGWRTDVVGALAMTESAIDFSDEGDVAGDALRQARTHVVELRAAVAAHLEGAHRGEIVREGFRVALLGPPNVGKSSLLNMLSRREAAIVSEEAGTTRDIVRVQLDLCGVAVNLSDTAGLREGGGVIEREGMRRALIEAQDSDLILWISDASAGLTVVPPALADCVVLKVLNKIDLRLLPGDLDQDVITVSARTGAGLDALVAEIARRAKAGIGDTDDLVPTQPRHTAALATALAHLGKFMELDDTEAELAAEELRHAAAAIGRLTGRVDAEEVLGAIFSRFCIGK